MSEGKRRSEKSQKRTDWGGPRALSVLGKDWGAKERRNRTKVLGLE